MLDSNSVVKKVGGHGHGHGHEETSGRGEVSKALLRGFYTLANKDNSVIYMNLEQLPNFAGGYQKSIKKMRNVGNDEEKDAIEQEIISEAIVSRISRIGSVRREKRGTRYVSNVVKKRDIE